MLTEKINESLKISVCLMMIGKKEVNICKKILYFDEKFISTI